MSNQYLSAFDAPEAKAYVRETSSAHFLKMAMAKLEALRSNPKPCQQKIIAAEKVLFRRNIEHQTDLNAIQALEDAMMRRTRGERVVCSIEAAAKLNMNSDDFERIVGLMKLQAIVRYGASGVYAIETAMNAKIYTPGYELDRLMYEDSLGVSLE